MHTLSKDAIGSARKIDAAMAGVLSWEARSDCIAAGAVYLGPDPKPVSGPSLTCTALITPRTSRARSSAPAPARWAT